MVTMRLKYTFKDSNSKLKPLEPTVVTKIYNYHSTQPWKT